MSGARGWTALDKRVDSLPSSITSSPSPPFVKLVRFDFSIWIPYHQVALCVVNCDECMAVFTLCPFRPHGTVHAASARPGDDHQVPQQRAPVMVDLSAAFECMIHRIPMMSRIQVCDSVDNSPQHEAAHAQKFGEKSSSTSSFQMCPPHSCSIST